MEAKQDETSVIGWDGTFELDQTANTCIVNNTVVSDPSVSRFSSEAGLSSTPSSGVTSADRQKEGGLHQEATDGQSETAEMEAKQDETSVIGWVGTFELDQTANTCALDSTSADDDGFIEDGLDGIDVKSPSPSRNAEANEDNESNQVELTSSESSSVGDRSFTNKNIINSGPSPTSRGGFISGSLALELLFLIIVGGGVVYFSFRKDTPPATNVTEGRVEDHLVEENSGDDPSERADGNGDPVEDDSTEANGGGEDGDVNNSHFDLFLGGPVSKLVQAFGQ